MTRPNPFAGIVTAGSAPHPFQDRSSRDKGAPGSNAERPEVVADDAYILNPLDWQALIRNGIPEIDYLDPPYIPRGARVWIWGATGTSKSMYALWMAARLSRQRIRVAYFSEENPTAEDLRRLALLRPEPDHLSFFHRTGMNLTNPKWIEAILHASEGAEAVFFDTWTDLWHGNEDSNEEVRDFDAYVLKALQARGQTPIIVHHSGHPQMFSNRKGAGAGRGASSLGQKADVALEFKTDDDGAFIIVYGKPRIGGERQPDRTFKVVDTEDGRGLDIVEVESSHTRAAQHLAEKMAQAILTAPKGFLTTSELRVAAGGGSGSQREAFALLEEDERVRVRVRKVETSDGRRRDARAWEPVEPRGMFG